MGPTVKAGVRTGFTVPDGSEKTGHKTRQKAKTEKANKPNNKQNPQSAKHFFSVQRLHGFRQVVQHALWHCKSINFQINTRGRLLIEGHKRELVKDLYIVQEAVIFNNKPNKAKTNHQNKTKTNPQKRNDWLPVHWQIHARGDNIVSPHHGMAANIKKGRTPTNTRPYPQVREATQHHAETRDPPSQDPRDHKAQAGKV